MGESRLYDLSQQLRLLARRYCACDASGRLISGGIDRQTEELRMELLTVLEQFQDFGTLPAGAAAVIARATALAHDQRQLITCLRREAERQADREAACPRRLVAA